MHSGENQLCQCCCEAAGAEHCQGPTACIHDLVGCSLGTGVEKVAERSGSRERRQLYAEVCCEEMREDGSGKE